MRQQTSILNGLAVTLLGTLTGCSSSDERVTRLATEQLRLNQQVAAQHQEIAQAARMLVEADQQSRQEFGGFTNQLQQERAELNQAYGALEMERKSMAAQRHRDPVVASAVLQSGLLLASLLPLIVCIYVLRVATSGMDGPIDLSELLIPELTGDQPLLGLSQPAAPLNIERQR